MKPLFLLLSIFMLASCAPATSPSTPQLISVYSTSAAEPWLQEAYACAADTSAVIARVADEASAQIVLRVGEPETLAGPAFEIDREDVLIVTNRESPVQNLDPAAARALFEGRGEPSVQVWVYASDEDVQQAFDRAVMAGGRTASTARLAADPQQMSDVLNGTENAVGILPRHWKAGSAREVFDAGTVPVLALTRDEPQGPIQNLIGCLQK